MGKGSAAGVASSLLVSYPGVKLALVVGTCGGAPPPPDYQEIFLGDVIISNSVVEYDFGRQYPGGREIRALLNSLCAENTRRVDNILFQACYLYKHYSNAPAGCSCFGNTVLTSFYIGPVASADMVMKSGQHQDEIVKREKVIGFEMEGAGVWDNVPCIIIKGVWNYADSHKNKIWQAYTAATRASAPKAFLEYWMPANRKDTSKHRHVMMPFARNPHFNLITVPDGPRNLAITGLGKRKPECLIFWIPCTSYEAVEQACMSIAQLVGLHKIEPANVKKQKWILIFNNADNTGIENGHVLFMSRSNMVSIPDLAFLPLAISQAAAYINHNDISLARYMSLLEIQNPVAMTWLVSLQIQRVDEVASDFLSFIACINPRDIPEAILPLTASAKRRVEALGFLKVYSFISAQINNSIWREYLPHALYVDNYHDFLRRIGSCLQSDGRYREAEAVF
ncbi:nucleoside phosphorylase domain-containing protein [Aspergillus egyptiacus]|nr:nucleoside phosphorylase domain-containing protein [Aspergillus egyptiacus]